MVNTFTPTTELLENDYSGHAYKELKEEIFNMTAQVKRSLDAGLSSSEANIAKKLLEATQAADNILDILYETFRK